MDFPGSMLIASLNTKHPQYEAEKAPVSLLKAYLEGGLDFPVNTQLRFKPIELSGDPLAGPMRTAREGAAVYTNYFGDTIAHLVSMVCKSALEICDKKERPYWDSLDGCTDGHYNTATSQARAALTDDFTYDNAFYLIRFPAAKSQGGNFQNQLDAGDLDAQIIALDSPSVIDWTYDPIGGLLSARWYEMELTGADYGTELHRWIIYTRDSIATYEATIEVGKKFQKGAKAALKSNPTHGLKVCPVFKVDRKLKCATGRKLLPTAKQLFNEESDASFYQFTTITGGIFVKTDDPSRWTKGVALTPFGAVILGPNDDVKRDAADSATLTALASASAARRAQLGGLIHAMAVQTSAQSQSGQNTSRASGKAIEAHSDPLVAWLCGFSEAHTACWRMMVSAIAAMRDEDDEDIQVSGLIPEDEADNPMALEKMQAEQIFSALPNVSKEAKDAHGIELGLAVNANADDETLEEIKNATIEEPEPAVIQLPPVGKPGQKPQGIDAA